MFSTSSYERVHALKEIHSQLAPLTREPSSNNFKIENTMFSPGEAEFSANLLKEGKKEVKVLPPGQCHVHSTSAASHAREYETEDGIGSVETTSEKIGVSVLKPPITLLKPRLQMSLSTKTTKL